MSTKTGRLHLLLGVAAVALVAFTAACEDPEDPPVATGISIFSGDGQFSKKGTPVSLPLTVVVRFDDGSASPRMDVRFEVTSGGGTLSRTLDRSDDSGIADTRLTLGPTAGANTVRATLESDPSAFVEFTASAGDFFCPEEDPSFTRKFGPRGKVVVLTRFSSLYFEPGTGRQTGLLGVTPIFTGSPRVGVEPMVSLPDDFFLNVPKDCAIGRTGDLFIAWKSIADEVSILEPDLSYRHFATLEDETASEVSMSPGAILMGVDRYGPFALGCRDTLSRFPADALFTGIGLDMCNSDAMAVDPANQDLYFIYMGDNTLKRLPLDSLVVEGALQTVTQLTSEEAAGARGMVVNDDDSHVFILVDATPTGTTKVILRVTPGGTKTTLYDFSTRGAGDAAGRQNDLALEPQGGGLLYTVDTLNDMLLVYDLTQNTLIEMPPDTTLTDRYAISEQLSQGERVGIMVLP